MNRSALPSRSSALPTLAASRGSGLSGSVVIFDDDALVRKHLELALRRLGAAPVCVGEIAGFRDAVAHHAPTVVLLDLALGNTDAIEIFALLEKQRYTGPVVLMSGDYLAALDHSKRIGVRLGVHIGGVLRKPFGDAELQSVLSSAISANHDAGPRDQAQPCPVSLQSAIDNGQVEFWYQPKLDLRTDLCAGIEILARVRRPDLGVLSPAAFLPGARPESLRWLAAEGLRESLVVMRQARRGCSSLAVAINVSPSMLESNGVLEELKAIREKIFPQAQVILEITETDLGEFTTADLFCTRAVLHDFKISIDDFGHGYSTFERLRSAPFSELKIERSLINGCAEDTAMQRLCGAAVRLAHDFDAIAVAEGIECKEDLAMVQALGFDQMQGYYFARPAPLSNLLASQDV